MRGAQSGVCLSLIVDACTNGTKRASLTADASSSVGATIEYRYDTAYDSLAYLIFAFKIELEG